MGRTSDYQQPPPTRRPLKIFAFDPMIGRGAGGRVTLDIPNETGLSSGPIGSRIEVIDYDGANNCFYTPVNLNDPAILMQHGLDPTESDPRFHQQMVYAVAMKVLENFDKALGRKIKFRGNRRLRIFPHAFHGSNAFYDPKLLAILFGYFRADKKNPGPNIPGQIIFTCLSHDIIAHEMAHALVDRMRYYFREPSNHDVIAFHEGFSDIVAIFQHFSFPAILHDHIQETRGDLRSPNNLIKLASEFGYATGKGQALRSAVDGGSGVPDPTLYQTKFEPYERGSLLVAAVFDAFFTIYQRRIKDLIRISTSGTGQLPKGDLHPDLVNRISSEAAHTAQSILRMCIRAFDYLPPVDITFGDYLRALITADFELEPVDEHGQRSAMIEAFRARGIYPHNVTSLADDALLCERVERNDELPPLPVNRLHTMQWLLEGAHEFSHRISPQEPSRESPAREISPSADVIDFQGEAWERSELKEGIRQDLSRYVRDKRVATRLGLDPKRPIRVQGFHSVFRVASHGELVVELVAQFMQKDEERSQDYEKYGGVPFRGGTTVIADANGNIRYIIAKPLMSPALSKEKQFEAQGRLAQQEAFAADCDHRDSQLAWADPKYYKNRISLTMNFSALHSEVIR